VVDKRGDTHFEVVDVDGGKHGGFSCNIRYFGFGSESRDMLNIHGTFAGADSYWIKRPKKMAEELK